MGKKPKAKIKKKPEDENGEKHLTLKEVYGEANRGKIPYINLRYRRNADNVRDKIKIKNG